MQWSQLAVGLRVQTKQKSQANNLTFKSDIIRARMASPDGVICVGLFLLSMFGNEVSS